MKRKTFDTLLALVIDPTVGELAEDKDYARDLRREHILPALEAAKHVSLDFRRATYVTQSFVHALIGEALKRYGDDVLDRIEFRHCSPQVKSIVELVVDYSLGGFSPRPAGAPGPPTRKAMTRRTGKAKRPARK